MELKEISHFFNKRIYSVPDYQRGYSWQPDHVNALLLDIEHSIRLDSTHYTGMVTIHDQNTPEKVGLNNYDIYHIVDGQQRMTTLILILSYLIRELKKVPDMKADALEKEALYIKCKGSYLFRYSIDKISEEYFNSLILESENLSSLDENLYTRNLLKAKNTISSYFGKEPLTDTLIIFLNAIEERLKFNEYKIDNVTEIGVVFETMNNRGIGLSNLEIVKNRLLYLTSKLKKIGKDEDLSSLENLENVINQKWSHILKNLTLPHEVLNEDTFLNNQWIIYHGWQKSNMAKKEILDEEFSIGKMAENPSRMAKSIKDYIESLAVVSMHWRFLNYPEEQKSFIEVKDKKTRSALQDYAGKLNRLSNSTIRPLLLAFMPLMKTDPKSLLSLFMICEVFCFRIFSMNKRRSDTGKNAIYRKCLEYSQNHTSPETITEAQTLLLYFTELYGDKERFDLEIKELFSSRKQSGYYSWSGLTYLLYEYELSLIKNDDRKVEYDFAKQRTKSIEHIFPQNYKKKGWIEYLKGMKPQERESIIHSLGNLVLINSNKNSELRDSVFSIKKERYKTGTHSEMEIANNNRVWSTKKIKSREKNS